MDTLLKSVFDLVQQYQDSGFTITCNAVIGEETSLTLKWNTSQRPAHTHSKQATPLRTSAKGKAKHKSPSQRRRDFRRLQAWKASRRRQDVRPNQNTGIDAISQPDSLPNVKINPTVNSQIPENCDTQNGLCDSPSMPIELVENFEAHFRALPSNVDSEVKPAYGRAFENYHRQMEHDQSWSHHINVTPYIYSEFACNRYPANLYFDPCKFLRLFKDGLEVAYMEKSDTAFKNECVVRHVDNVDYSSFMLVPEELRWTRTAEVANMILALKQHVTTHKCRDWNFKSMNTDTSDNYW